MVGTPKMFVFNSRTALVREAVHDAIILRFNMQIKGQPAQVTRCKAFSLRDFFAYLRSVKVSDTPIWQMDYQHLHQLTLNEADSQHIIWVASPNLLDTRLVVEQER
jgi:hypothetical protein